MAITSERFELALKQLSGKDWAVFERLSSSFLAADFPDIRTMAAPDGDKGRDSELFNPSGMPFVVVQYSVQEEWAAKIRQTVSRLEETFPGPKTLIYMSSQQIGSAADKLRVELSKKQIALDVRDRSWFIDRMHLDPQKAESAAALARQMVDPLLESAGIETQLVAGLSSQEAKTALVFLEMQYLDTDAAYGLTKSSFDALTRAALKGTSTEHRLSRPEIHAKIARFLPQHSAVDLMQPINSALERLAKHALRWRKDNDEYHLLPEESERLKDSAAVVAALKAALDTDIHEILEASTGVKVTEPEGFVGAVRVALETYFLRKGEEFASLVVQGLSPEVDKSRLRDVATATTKERLGVVGRNQTDFLMEVLETLLNAPSPSTQKYLQLLSQSYTLFAFLAESPDVQKVSRQMFCNGEIWLDTSVLLPALAELSREEGSRPFSTIFKQAKALGLKLYITHGVLEEIERHVNKCRSYVRSNDWHGNTPYLYTQYVLSVGKPDRFLSWLENFAGEQTPEEDIAEYLRLTYGVRVEKSPNISEMPSDLVAEIREAWRSIHEERRKADGAFNMMSNRLADHDSENYLTVLQTRLGQKGRSPLGYTSWWLTMDSKARRIKDYLSDESRELVKASPVLSIDFLVRYLAFGPNRERVDLTGTNLASIYTGEILESLPPELLKVAQEVRESHSHLEEFVIRRRIRDRLNAERVRAGAVERAGVESALEAIRELR